MYFQMSENMNQSPCSPVVCILFIFVKMLINKPERSPLENETPPQSEGKAGNILITSAKRAVHKSGSPARVHKNKRGDAPQTTV